jgi:hypothetical protein
MTTLELPEPTIRKKERSMTARYDTGLTKTEEYSERVRKILLTLHVHYVKAGINYFSGERTTTDRYEVSLINETEADGMIGFALGSGIGVARIEQPSNRFSRKKLEQIFDEWREKIEGMLSLADVQAASLLTPEEFAMREKIRPYWNGEKAGLA